MKKIPSAVGRKLSLGERKKGAAAMGKAMGVRVSQMKAHKEKVNRKAKKF